jgi:hypothetical protein
MLDDLLVEVLGGLLNAVGTLEDVLEDSLVAMLNGRTDGLLEEILVEILGILLDNADVEVLEYLLKSELAAVLDG